MNRSFTNLSWRRRLPRFVLIYVGLGIGAILANILLWVMALVMFPRGDQVSILHYSAGIGADFIGESADIMVVPRIGMMVTFFNLALASLVWPADKRAAWLLLLAVPLVLVLLSLSLTFLWQVNG